MHMLIPLREQKILCEALRLKRPILIEGESGTGKTGLGHWLLQQNQEGHSMPLIYVNCKEFSREQLESVFDTRFTKRNMHSMFLIDGIELLSLNLQAKLLSYLEQHPLYLVSIAHVSMAKKVARGEFRPDLYARIKCHNIILKSLREQTEDLPEILQKMAFSLAHLELTPEILHSLCKHDWPGNLTEVTFLFENIRLLPKLPNSGDWSRLLKQSHKAQSSTVEDSELQSLREQGLKKFLRKIEQSLVRKIYENNQGHVRKTLQDLKISSGAFYRAFTP